MFEVFVLVPVRKSFTVKLASTVSLFLGLASLFLACSSGIFAILFILFAALWYVLTFQANKEYEYSYFDGEVRFARVMNCDTCQAVRYRVPVSVVIPHDPMWIKCPIPYREYFSVRDCIRCHRAALQLPA